MQKSARSVTCESEKTRKNYDSMISLYNKVGPQAAICRFTSGFTFQLQMRYPVLVQISANKHALNVNHCVLVRHAAE